MAKNKKQRTIKVRPVTGDQIRFLSDKSGLSKTQLLAEVFEAIFQIACTYGSLNFEYEYDTDKVTIVVSGKNNLVVGELKHPDAEKESQVKPLLRVKCKDTKGFVELRK